MPPVNDNFADATVISGLSGSVTGTNVGATFESGEPDPQVGGGTSTVWWKWTAPADGDVTFHLGGSSFDTVLEIYTGNALDSLILVDYDDDGDVGLTSQMTFTASLGTVYYVRVRGYGTGSSYQGTIDLAWSMVIDQPNPPPDVTPGWTVGSVAMHAAAPIPTPPVQELDLTGLAIEVPVSDGHQEIDLTVVGIEVAAQQSEKTSVMTGYALEVATKQVEPTSVMTGYAIEVAVSG